MSINSGKQHTYGDEAKFTANPVNVVTNQWWYTDNADTTVPPMDGNLD